MIEFVLSTHSKLFSEGDMGELDLIKGAYQRPEQMKRLKELGVNQNKTGRGGGGALDYYLHS